MPLVRIELNWKGKSSEYKKTLLNCVHCGLIESFAIEDLDRFQRTSFWAKSGGQFLEKFLRETEFIDFNDSLIKEKVNKLRNKSFQKNNNSDTCDLTEYIKRAYLFVRDEISHTWDEKKAVVSKKASDVLRNKTGICWTK